MTYKFGSVKQHAETSITAVRTVWPQDSLMAWLVANPNTGGHWAPHIEVETWPDMILIVDAE